MLSQRGVRELSLRTVLFVMVQYYTMWMGEKCIVVITDLLSKSRHLNVCHESSMGHWTFCFWDRVLGWSWDPPQGCDLTASASLFKCAQPCVSVSYNCYSGWRCIIANSLLVEIYAQIFTLFFLENWFYSMTQPGKWMQMITQRNIKGRCIILHLIQGGVLEVSELLIPPPPFLRTLFIFIREPACMSLCTKCTACPCGSVWASDLQEVELKMVVGYSESARNQTQALCKSSWCSE